MSVTHVRFTLARSVLERSSITVGKDAGAQTFPLNSAVIACAGSSDPECKDLGPLLRYFDLVVGQDDQLDAATTDAICSALFSAGAVDCSGSEDTHDAGPAALGVRLRAARLLEPALTAEAEALLAAFWDASRRALAYGVAGGLHYSLESLSRLARAAAALRLSPQVMRLVLPC
jgi:hypothetical protein